MIGLVMLDLIALVLAQTTDTAPVEGGGAETAGADGVADGVAEGAGGGAGGGADGGVGFAMPTDLDGWMALFNHYGLPAIKALLLLFVTWLLSRWAKRAVLAGMTRGNLDPTLGRFASNMARWAVLAFGIIAILGIFGIPTATFAAALASLGLAIGLALQGSLGNAAAGIMLLVFRPFKVGDFIKAAGVDGIVTEIDLFTTVIDTGDNRRLIVPNGSVFGSTIENVTFHPRRRADISVGVSYTASVDETRRALTAAVGSVEGVMADPAPAVVLTGLGASSVDWVVRAWATREDFWAVRERLIAAIKKSLDDAEIGIPFPQMDIHVDGVLRRELEEAVRREDSRGG